MSRGKILFQLSGSIACFKACSVISRLVQNDFEVEVVATKSALEFVGRATLEGLTGRRTHVEMFEPGSYMNHIDLMKWADLVILCPATANTISKLANGIGDDLLTSLFLAHDFKKPYLVSPAMNVKMYEHPALKESLSKLKAWGVQVLETGTGALACGDVGEGRLLEPDVIYDLIIAALSPAASLNGQNILVTSGGTREPLDGVRYLTNISTGKTGAQIAESLAEVGASVTYLHAEGAATPSPSMRIRQTAFSSYVSLEKAVSDELRATNYSAIIHAAAVGDFSLEAIQTSTGSHTPSADGKLDSTGGIQLKLKRNPKLLSSFRNWSRNKDLKVIAFKLTNANDLALSESAVAKLIIESTPDYVVQNELGKITDASHPFRIYRNESSSPLLVEELDGAVKLAEFLGDVLAPGGIA
jgi:phosphopantothenoylcysteine decarboxylase/phosphopantothenate--cysteine ligase